MDIKVLLKKQSDKATGEVIDFFGNNKLFLKLADYEAKRLDKRDKDDAFSLESGITIAVKKGLLDCLEKDPHSACVEVDNKSAAQVAKEIMDDLDIDKNIKVQANISMLYQLFNIIFSNALKYTHKNQKKININTEIEKDMVIISITDNGIGMTKEQIKHVFEEFYKVDESRHDLMSHGLDLTISKKIIEHHGGNIWVKSSGIGKGSTFYFKLKKGIVK